jgi:hypothetical protein
MTIIVIFFKENLRLNLRKYPEIIINPTAPIPPLNILPAKMCFSSQPGKLPTIKVK